jgi:hypothetical protein
MVKGDSVELGVTVDVPGGRQCELINRAATVFPVAGTRYNNVIGDDVATATSRIPAKTCDKTERPQCKPGTNELRSSSGACVCKTGFIRDGAQACVRIIAEPELCPDGKPVPRNGRCPSVTPKCEPDPGEFRNDDGQCVCKRGLERNGRGRCVEKPTPQCEPGRNEYRDDDGRCVCKRGFERDSKGRCVEPANPADDCRKKGWTWTGKRCIEPTSPADDCRKQGKIWDGKRCIDKPSPADACRKKGWTWTGKRCVEPAPKPCPRGTTGTPPNCKPMVKPKCPSGTIGLPPNCKSIVKPKCPIGMVGSPPNCKRIVKPKCPRGTTGTFPNCKKVPS